MNGDKETDKNSKKKKKPFKWTKMLISIAINNGWTQEAIAQKCRTQQSVVSAWKRGEKQATESQIKPLLDLYGAELRRKTFKLYYKEENKENDIIECSFIKVEGKVIFTRVFYKSFSIQNGRNSKIKRIPHARLVVQDRGDSCFILTICDNKSYHNLFKYDEGSKKEILDHDKLYYYSGEEFWRNCILKEFKNTSEIINFIDEFFMGKECNKFFNTNYPFESEQMPFLIREALLNQGFSIDGIETYHSNW